MTTRLILVRHGQTEANKNSLALGRADVPLNELGREQASRLANALSNDPITKVYASPLSRTRETAGPIAAALGLEVQIEESLIEMDVGELDGLDFGAVRENYPGFTETWLSDDGPEQPMPGGESLRQVFERSARFLEHVKGEHSGLTTCAVSHNFVILTMLVQVMGLELRSFRRLRHGVGAVSVVEWDGKMWRVEKLNDTCHLD